MSILILLTGGVYLAVGFGCAMLSLHELAAGGRDRPINRLMAWSNVLLWLPLLLVVAVAAFFYSQRSAQRPVSSMARQADSVLAEGRSLRRVARQS